MIARDIREQAGLAKFSPELLELAGTNEAIQKAKEQTIAKYVSEYALSMIFESVSTIGLIFQLPVSKIILFLRCGNVGIKIL